jgi:hypothetical protein
VLSVVSRDAGFSIAGIDFVNVGMTLCEVNYPLTLRTFLRGHAVIADPSSVANIHHADDRLKRGSAISPNHNRLIRRIALDRNTQQSLQFIQACELSMKVNESLRININNYFSRLAGHGYRAGGRRQDNVKSAFFFLKLAGDQKENQQQKDHIDQWRQAERAGD